MDQVANSVKSRKSARAQPDVKSDVVSIGHGVFRESDHAAIENEIQRTSNQTNARNLTPYPYPAGASDSVPPVNGDELQTPIGSMKRMFDMVEAIMATNRRQATAPKASTARIVKGRPNLFILISRDCRTATR
jgi:hypothetical protein